MIFNTKRNKKYCFDKLFLYSDTNFEQKHKELFVSGWILEPKI